MNDRRGPIDRPGSPEEFAQAPIELNAPLAPLREIVALSLDCRR
jgi:hypothetical protein